MQRATCRVKIPPGEPLLMALNKLQKTMKSGTTYEHLNGILMSDLLELDPHAHKAC